MVGQRIDTHNARTRLLGDGLCAPTVELWLDKNHLDIILLTKFAQLLHAGSRRLLAIRLNGNLRQAIVACKVGEGWVVNHEGTRGLGLREQLAHDAVAPVNA